MKLTPVELLAREYVNAMGYAIMNKDELEQLRQAIIKDFVNSLETVAWMARRKDWPVGEMAWESER